MLVMVLGWNFWSRVVFVFEQPIKLGAYAMSSWNFSQQLLQKVNFSQHVNRVHQVVNVKGTMYEENCFKFKQLPMYECKVMWRSNQTLSVASLTLLVSCWSSHLLAWHLSCVNWLVWTSNPSTKCHKLLSSKWTRSSTLSASPKPFLKLILWQNAILLMLQMIRDHLLTNLAKSSLIVCLNYQASQ